MAENPRLESEPIGTPARQIRKRTTKACDSCRLRKIKCIYTSGPTCDGCDEYGVPCTTDTPSHKRGPKSRRVRGRLESSASEASGPALNAPSVASSNTPAQVLPATTFDIEQLAPLSVITSVVNDWFELIYSVCPILHRARFLRRLASGEASKDVTFGVLVLSVCAATIASLKRKRLFEYSNEGISPDRCIQLAEEAGFFSGRKEISLERCQALYNFGVARASTHGMDDPDFFVFTSEAAAGIKWLTSYCLRAMTPVDQEMLKRTFWIFFAALCTSDLHGRPSVGLLTNYESISVLALVEVNDAELTGEDPSAQWHGDQMSYVPGLKFLSKLFLVWYQSQQSGNNTIAHLQHHTNEVRCALDWLPPELQWRGGLSRTRGNFGTDVQTANLYITQLHIRHNLLEQMKIMSKRESGGMRVATPIEIIDERQSIVDDMLEILTHMPQRVLESNGFSLLPKIRDIGSSLLEDSRAGEWQDVGTPGAQRNLERLLEILRELDPAEHGYLGISPAQ